MSILQGCQNTHNVRHRPLFSLFLIALQSTELWRGHEIENHVRTATGDCTPLGGAITPSPAPQPYETPSRLDRLLSIGSCR